MPLTIHRTKLKPEIEFQYSSRSFLETGSSFISAVYEMWSKFGTIMYFHSLKQISH